MKPEATVTGLTSPLNECHTLTLLVSVATTELAITAQGSLEGPVKGQNVVKIDGNTCFKRFSVRVERLQVNEEASSVTPGVDPLIVALCGLINDAFFVYCKSGSGGEHTENWS